MRYNEHADATTNNRYALLANLLLISNHNIIVMPNGKLLNKPATYITWTSQSSELKEATLMYLKCQSELDLKRHQPTKSKNSTTTIRHQLTYCQRYSNSLKAAL